MNFENTTGNLSDDENIVSIGPARAKALFPTLARVESYWEGLRDGRAMPTRAEVDPRGIADVLGHAFMLEQVAPGVSRIRLAGMHLNELMAMEVRGMPITAMFLPEARRELQKVMQRVLETPAVVRLTLGSDTGFTRPPLEGQMMLLPLRDAHGNATRILGVLETKGRIGRGPRRFSIRDIETKPVAADRPRPEVDMITAEQVSHNDAPIRDDGKTAFDEFAPRTAALVREIAARQKRRDAEQNAQDQAAQDREASKGRRGHLRLVHDADAM